MNTRGLHAVAVGALVIVILPFLVHLFPAVVGMSHSYVVMSGSMEPAIQTGSVVYVDGVSAEDIQVDDVITFRLSPGGPTTTHRVIDIEETDAGKRFVTKGDANENSDGEAVPPDGIVGKVAFSLPYLGYLIAFAGSRIGLIVLLVVPSVALIAFEIRDLFRAATAEPDDPD